MRTTNKIAIIALMSSLVCFPCAADSATPSAFRNSGPGDFGPPRAKEACEWASGFAEQYGVGHFVYALEKYDDGSGEALFAAGRFESAGAQRSPRIAKRTSEGWEPLTDSVEAGIGNVDPFRGEILALEVYDDGTGPALYAAGNFDYAGGVTVNSIAKWDGETWSPLSGPLGTGLTDLDSRAEIRALQVYDDGGGSALYVGGRFLEIGGIAASNLAKWDGSTWATIDGLPASGLGGDVEAMTIFDDGTGSSLYVGGAFLGGLHAGGGTLLRRVGKWGGSQWSPLGTDEATLGTDRDVQTLAVHDDGSGPALYVGGEFEAAGGISSPAVARWDGAWSAVGSIYAGDGVSMLYSHDDGRGAKLFAAGEFSILFGSKQHLARWDGQAWSILGRVTGVTGGIPLVQAMMTLDEGAGPYLVVAGLFYAVGDDDPPSTPTERVQGAFMAQWRDEAWRRMAPVQPSHPLGGVANALATFDPGTGELLFAGGNFERYDAADIRVPRHIMQWDDSEWSEVGSGTDGEVHALAVFDDGLGLALYVGGSFSSAGGVVDSGTVARWDGTSWSSLDPSLSGEVLALEVYDDGTGPGLYAAGPTLTLAGMSVATGVVLWDGSNWSEVRSASSSVSTLEITDLVVFDAGSGAELIASGRFEGLQGTNHAHRVMRWDGFTWADLADEASPVGDETAKAVAVFDDGEGESLYVGGDFLTFAGAKAEGLARWDGTSWHVVPGTRLAAGDVGVQSLYVDPNAPGAGIYAGGGFRYIGDQLVNGIARFDGQRWQRFSGPEGVGLGVLQMYVTPTPDKRTVTALVSYPSSGDGDLFVAGSFQTAGGVLAFDFASHPLWCLAALFADGFESGDFQSWTTHSP